MSTPRTSRARRPVAPPAAAWLILLVVGAARAQPPGTPGEMPVPSTPKNTTKKADLANRYRLAERYARDDEREAPGTIGAYRMGVVEVVKESIDTPQGAPRRSETTRQSIFTERGVEQVGSGIVSGAVLQFERFRVRPEDRARTMGPKPLDGLTVYYRPKVGDLPLVLSQTPNRKLTDYEYEVVSRQVFAPHMAAILPPQAVRIGESWRIPRRGAQAMLGEPGLQGDTLIGKFAELRKEVDGPRFVAVITISGRLTAPSGETAVNAEAFFTYGADDPATRPAAPAPGPTLGRPVAELIEARGAITELRLARSTGGPLPGPGRLRYQVTRELTVQRQVGLSANLLPTPKFEGPPTATDPGAWLTLVDPSGRFTLDHPQDLLPPERALLAPASPGEAVLGRQRREGADLIRVAFHPKALAPEALKERLAAEYGKTKMEIVKGAEEWLPEADWPRMKVYRIEAAVKVPERNPGAASNPPRVHFDGYLLQPGQAASFLVLATTSRDAVAPFRHEVEEILKTLQVDPARPAVE